MLGVVHHAGPCHAEPHSTNHAEATIFACLGGSGSKCGDAGEGERDGCLAFVEAVPAVTSGQPSDGASKNSDRVTCYGCYAAGSLTRAQTDLPSACESVVQPHVLLKAFTMGSPR